MPKVDSVWKNILKNTPSKQKYLMINIKDPNKVEVIKKELERKNIEILNHCKYFDDNNLIINAEEQVFELGSILTDNKAYLNTDPLITIHTFN